MGSSSKAEMGGLAQRQGTDLGEGKGLKYRKYHGLLPCSKKEQTIDTITWIDLKSIVLSEWKKKP